MGQDPRGEWFFGGLSGHRGTGPGHPKASVSLYTTPLKEGLRQQSRACPYLNPPGTFSSPLSSSRLRGYWENAKQCLNIFKMRYSISGQDQHSIKGEKSPRGKHSREQNSLLRCCLAILQEEPCSISRYSANWHLHKFTMKLYKLKAKVINTESIKLQRQSGKPR